MTLGSSYPNYMRMTGIDCNQTDQDPEKVSICAKSNKATLWVWLAFDSKISN